MIDKAEARRIIVGEAGASRQVDPVPLATAFGRVLASDARSDVDLPPFEKSSMDGWAVRAEDVARVPAKLRVLGAIHAGQVATRPVGRGETWKIMTGAPLPEGADAVVIVEDSEMQDGGASVALRREARAWQNVCRKGEDVRAGDVVLPAGTPLDAAALALLSSIGVDPVPTFRPPLVCVIPTGDELVDAAGPPPLAGHIRESNGIMLEAQIRQVSPAIPVVRPGIARDTRASLDAFLDVGLDHDVLILSGGVSMGDLDLVGGELERRGIEVLVEKVSIKPGKPLLFGHVARKDGGRCTVFGLPGNPVSSFVTFEIFVRPFLLRALGHDDVAPDVVRAVLETDRELRIIPRTQHLPAVLSSGADGTMRVRPLVWHGSADMRGVVDANAMIVVEPGSVPPRGGDLVAVERLVNRPIGVLRKASGEPAEAGGPNVKTFLRDLFWGLVSMGLWAAAFHPLDLWPLAWIALVPTLVRTATDVPGKRRLGLVWVLSQFLLHWALMGWAAVIAPPLAFLTPILGIPFSWLTGFLLQRGIVRLKLPLLFVAPLTIVLVEVLRDQALQGLSWASIGYSQWRFLDLLQLASAGRVHLMSLVILLANAAIATAIVRWRAGASMGARLRPVLLGALVVVVAAGAGRLIRPRDFEDGPLGVGLQPNIPQGQRARVRASDNLRIHHKLLSDFRERHPGLEPDLLVYSETSLPRTEEPKYTLDDFLKNRRLLADVGGPGREFRMSELVLQGPEQVSVLGLLRGIQLPDADHGGPRDDDEDGYDETNVAWVVKGGVPTDVIYEKRGLAPFGEFTPVPVGTPGRDLIRGMIRSALGRIPGLNPGTCPTLFEAHAPSGNKRGGLTICFEIVFPWYFREAVRCGADFHVNISNDAWFDGSSELELVDVATIFRAVESGRALFRVSNSGISTLIAPDGGRVAVVESAEGRRTQVRGAFHGRIPIRKGLTGYVLLGDLPWIGPALLLLSVLLVATIRAKRCLPAVSVR